MRVWILFGLMLRIVSLVMGQGKRIILTVSIEDALINIVDDDLFAVFEADHPGVDVMRTSHQIDDTLPSPPDSAEGVEAFLEAAWAFASSADMLYLSSRDLHPEVIHAGVLLDLSALLGG